MEKWRRIYMWNQLADISIQYLHTKSCHPKHSKTAIPYSQGLKIKEFARNGKTSRSEHLLDSKTNQAINTSDTSSHLRSNQQSLHRVPIVVMYHPYLPMLEQTIRHYHHILQDSEWLREAIPSLPIIAFRQPRNLRDPLVHPVIS